MKCIYTLISNEVITFVVVVMQSRRVDIKLTTVVITRLTFQFHLNAYDLKVDPLIPRVNRSPPTCPGARHRTLNCSRGAVAKTAYCARHVVLTTALLCLLICHRELMCVSLHGMGSVLTH